MGFGENITRDLTVITELWDNWWAYAFNCSGDISSSPAVGGLLTLLGRICPIPFLKKTWTIANSNIDANTNMRQVDIHTSIAVM